MCFNSFPQLTDGASPSLALACCGLPTVDRRISLTVLFTTSRRRQAERTIAHHHALLGELTPTAGNPRPCHRLTAARRERTRMSPKWFGRKARILWSAIRSGTLRIASREDRSPEDPLYYHRAVCVDGYRLSVCLEWRVDDGLPLSSGGRYGRRGAGGKCIHQRIHRCREARSLLSALRGDFSDRFDVCG